MTTITTTWKSGGVQQSLTSTAAEGESLADFFRRHYLAYCKALEMWPADPQ